MKHMHTSIITVRCGTVCLNSVGNRTSPSDNSNDRWKRLCLVSWAAASCLWTLMTLTRNLLTYLLTYHIISKINYIVTSHINFNFKLARLCYLATSFRQPGYLANLISPYSQSRLLRSSTQKLLSVPPHNLDTAARRFSVAAPRLWNSLPLNCRTAPSVNTFKIRLKTFLFDSA